MSSSDVTEAEGDPAEDLVGDDAAVELAVLDGVEEVRLGSFENGAVEVLSVRLGEFDLVLVVDIIGEGLPGGEVANLLVLLFNGRVGRDRMRLGGLTRAYEKGSKIRDKQNLSIISTSYASLTLVVQSG